MRSLVITVSLVLTLIAAVLPPTTQECNLQGFDSLGMVFFWCPEVLCDDTSPCMTQTTGTWEDEVWFCLCNNGGPTNPLIKCRAFGYFHVDPLDPDFRIATWSCNRESCARTCKKTGVPLLMAPKYLCTC
jgi:hypothetical protein